MDHPLVDSITEVSGLTADRARYLLCMLGSYPLALLFSTLLSPARASPTVRHLFQLTAGLLFCIFCFRLQVLLLLLDTGVCYLLILFSPPRLVHLTVFWWAITFMSVSHIYRMYTDYNGYTLDFTGPTMIITMKVTSLACSVYDGTHRKEEDLNNDQKLLAIRRTPTVIEYLSYMFCFTSVLSGPTFNLQDYLNFIDGSNTEQGKPVPSGILPALLKFVAAVFFISWTFVIPADWEPFFDAEWRESHSLLYAAGYLYLMCFITRCNYYFAWTLADSVSNLSGFGFNGYKENGGAKWDKITNVYPHKTECSSSLKVLTDNWNVGTALWLRRVCYERSVFAPTAMTYLLSATWHGFYPGYYGCFMSATLFLLTSRKLRRVVRPKFLGSSSIKMFYDALTTVCSLLLINFASIQLCLLSYERNYVLYKHFYCLPHIVCFLIYVFCPSPKPKKE